MKASDELTIDLSEQFPHLASAPIVEAVIHWQARAQVNIHPEKFEQQLKAKLGDYPDSKVMREYQFEAALQTDGPSIHSHTESWDGIRFTSTDKTYVAQFKKDGLVVSRLEPYMNWETFVAEAERLWTIFVDLAKPLEVQRLGVRFINRIKSTQIEGLGKLLRHPPKRLEALGFPIRHFFYQSTHDVPGHPYRINIIDTIQPSGPSQNEGLGIIIDIDAFTTCAMGTDLRVLKQHMAELHWLKNKAFFNLLTKSGIKKFGKEPG